MNRQFFNVVDAEFNNTKAFKTFCNSVSEIREGSYTDLRNIEDNNPKLFNKYSNAIKDLIQDDFMYSSKQYEVKEKNEAGEKVPKLDENGIPITSSNYDMVCSLSESGFMDTETILYDLWSHILIKGLYFINNANDIKHTYNLIKMAVHNKLCDFCRSMNRNDKMINAVSLSESVENDEGDEVLVEIADENMDTERSASVWEAKNIIVHKNIRYLLSQNKPHRMICYIASICGMTNEELYNEIHNNGYESAIHKIVDELHGLGIDADYLNDTKMMFPKEHDKINKHYIETAKNHSINQIHEYMVNQGVSAA